MLSGSKVRSFFRHKFSILKGNPSQLIVPHLDHNQVKEDQEIIFGESVLMLMGRYLG